MKKGLMSNVSTLLLASAALLVLSCSETNKESEAKSNLVLNYLPVQVEKDGNWSIMDSDGKLVVKDEYSKDSEISDVSGNGTYWVKTNGKLSLFSVESPKKPIVDKEYDDATIFVNERAFVSVFGEPIQLIDEKGKVIKTLPKNIVEAYQFANGKAKFQDKNGRYGYLDTNGDVAIEAKYFDGIDFSEGLAAVQMKKGGDYIVIDAKGDQQGVIKNGVVSDSWGVFSEGKIPVTDSMGIVRGFYDKTGNKVFTVRKENSYTWGSMFVDGYCVLLKLDNGDNGVTYSPYIIDDKGERIIRDGKYSWICNLGNGHFFARKNDKWGIIDKEDNELVGFDYDEAYKCLLGDNYIVKQGNYYLLIDKNGKEIPKTEFAAFGNGATNYKVTFVDVNANVKAITDLFDVNGYVGMKGKTDMPSIAKLFNLSLEDCEFYSHCSETKEIKVGDWDGTFNFCMNNFIKTENTHTESVNDGWFEREVIVSDGINWNPEARLSSVYVNIRFPENVDADILISKIKEGFKNKGFKDDGTYLVAKKGSLNVEIESSTAIKIEFDTQEYY